MKDTIIIYTTCADLKEAKKIGEHLVKKHLVACANYFPVESVYEWEGKIHYDEEAALILKTFADLYDDVEKEIIKLHSYDVPAVSATKVLKTNKSCLVWMEEVVG